MPAGETLLEAQAIELWRGDHHLLRGVSLSVRAGELVQLTGPNGAGKTSLLRILCGLLPPESGEIRWRGESIETSRDTFHRELVYLAHLNALKAELTADENLATEVGLKRATTAEERGAVLRTLGIAQCAPLPARVLSAGQRRRLAFARVLLTRGTLWVLDEPTTNLDTQGVTLVEGLLKAHLDTGGAILTAAHHGLLSADPRSRSIALAA